VEDKVPSPNRRSRGAMPKHQAAMRYQWQQLLERIWPSRSGPTTEHAFRNAILHMALLLAIALAAGPDAIAAMELNALLEILGATLFLTVYTSSAKLMAVEFGRAIRNMSLPLAPLLLVRSDAPRLERMRAVAYVAANAAWWLVCVLSISGKMRTNTKLSS
jgi:hypothetical protein